MISSRKSRGKQECGDPGAWTVQDRIEEVKGKLTLKRRDQDAYYAFSQQNIKDNESLIRNLRAEIKEKQILQKQSLNADEYVIRSGFGIHRESQLAMQRYNVAKAINEKNEHVFDKMGQLDAARHERNRRLRKMGELALTLRDLKCAARTNDEGKSSQRVRALTTSLDKMMMKCSSATFIQKTYKQILYHLEREGLTLPGRLNKLEMNLQSVKNELKNELIQIQKEAKSAYDQTKVEKEQLESKILKGKRARDSTLTSTRKKFKKLNQEVQEKETRPRKRINHKLSQNDSEDNSRVGRGNAKSFWEKVRTFWALKHAMDKLQDKTCVNHPSYIASCFQRQIQRHVQLSTMVDELVKSKKAMADTSDKVHSELDEIKKTHQNLLEDTGHKIDSLNLKHRSTIEFGNKASFNLGKAGDLLFAIANSVDHIRHKVASCDWMAREVHRRHGSSYKLSTVLQAEELEDMDPYRDCLNSLVLSGDRLHQIELSLKVINSESEEQRLVVASVDGDVAQDALVSIRASAPHNARVVIADDEDILPAEDFLCDDDDDNDQYLSRDAIKSAMQQLSENATARRKRRRQKTKK